MHNKESIILINADSFKGTIFVETRETTEGFWLFSKEPMKQEQTLLYQGDTFELDSVQCIFYNDTSMIANMSMIFKYSNPTTTEIDRARNNRYFSSKLD